MGRSLISLTALLAAASAYSRLRHDTQPYNAPAPWNAAVVPTVAAMPAPPIGFAVAPGVTFVPSAFSEIGYDSNPDLLSTIKRSSAFIRSGVGFNFSAVTPTTVATAAPAAACWIISATTYTAIRFASPVRQMPMSAISSSLD